MSGTPVWIGQELEVAMFLEDPITGEPLGMTDKNRYNPSTDIPLIKYCFWQSASIEKSVPHRRMPGTDWPVPRIKIQAYTYTCSITAMHCIMEEFGSEALFNRNTVLQIFFTKVSQHNQRNWEYEQGRLISARAVRGRAAYGENDVTKVTGLTFAAEDFSESRG